MPDDPLELETRRRIYQHVQKFPGAHMREIGRDLAIPMGTLEYHLHYLVKSDLLVIRQDPRYTRYFAEGELSRRDKDVLAVLRQKVPRQIAAHLLLEPGSSHGTILTKFELAPSTLSFHIKKLVGAGIVSQEKVGRENLYRVVEPELVARVLIAHKESFFDDVIDRFAEVWQGLEARPASEPAGDTPPPGGALMVFQMLARAVALA
ncbi:MAG TPA: transcriptional regulator [Candidatus Thermoplasmatota archaeon]|nr:transcriptional regulator [Candidatus Thermoplasmatota archaeon]